MFCFCFLFFSLFNQSNKSHRPSRRFFGGTHLSSSVYRGLSPIWWSWTIRLNTSPPPYLWSCWSSWFFHQSSVRYDLWVVALTDPRQSLLMPFFLSFASASRREWSSWCLQQKRWYAWNPNRSSGLHRQMKKPLALWSYRLAVFRSRLCLYFWYALLPRRATAFIATPLIATRLLSCFVCVPVSVN